MNAARSTVGLEAVCDLDEDGEEDDEDEGRRRRLSWEDWAVEDEAVVSGLL
jgi:hypothetical protein